MQKSINDENDAASTVATKASEADVREQPWVTATFGKSTRSVLAQTAQNLHTTPNDDDAASTVPTEADGQEKQPLALHEQVSRIKLALGIASERTAVALRDACEQLGIDATGLNLHQIASACMIQIEEI